MENTNLNEKTLTYEQIGAYINSPRFAQIVAECKLKNNDDIYDSSTRLIGLAFDYLDVFGKTGHTSLEELDEMLLNCAKESEFTLGSLGKKKILRDLGLQNVTEITPEQQQKIDHNVDYILTQNWSKFHAYNGAFHESIQKSGITANNDFLSDEIEEVKKLQKKYNVSTYIGADDGKVCFSSTADVSFRYACTSPEWFSRMCGWGFHYRDYELSKKNVEAATHSFSPEDKQRYCELFEKFWSTFAPQKTYLAIMAKDPLSEEQKEVLSEINQETKEMICNSDSLNFLNVMLGDKTKRNNGKSSETLVPETIIEFPDLMELCKNVTHIRDLKNSAQLDTSRPAPANDTDFIM